MIPSATWRFLAGLALAVAIIAAGVMVAADAPFWPVALASLLVLVAATVVFAMVVRDLLGPAAEIREAMIEVGEGGEIPPAGLRRVPPEWRDLANSIEEVLAQLAHREESLREGIAQMNAVLASMIEGVLATDENGRVLLANDAACQMLSRPVSQLAGHRLLDVVRYPSLRAAIEQARLTREGRKIELETMAHEGPRRMLLASVTPLPESTAGALAIVLHDVTELRRMETMRQDFVANVSHELKTPLSAIKACAETLRLGALHDETVNTGFVEQIEIQADLLDQQVQKLLELSRAQSGRAAMDIRPVDLYQACHVVVERFRPEADSRSVTLELESAGQGISARVDADAIDTILGNLVSNALRYTPAKGRVIVRIRSESGQPVLEVIDTGIGIAAEHQSRVFERFYRVDRARSRSQGGTGLGLAIVKHLAQSLGGTIELESRVGRGSTFRIRLPATQPAATE